MSDVDRIIAAQAAQARKTRALLVFLLLGVPIAAAAIWAGVYFLAIRPAAPSTVTPTVNSNCVYTDGKPNLYDVYCQTPAP